MAKPSELRSENERGETKCIAPTADPFVGYSTNVCGWDFCKSAEKAGLGGVNESTIGFGQREKMQGPAPFIPN